MNRKLRSLIQYLFFLGLGLFLLWLTLRKSDWNSILNDLSEARYLYLLPATLMLIISHFVRALRWNILIAPLGHHPRTVNTFFAVLIGYWANLAVPRLGEVLKCTALARYEKIPADKLVGTIVAERVIDVASLAIIFFLCLVSQYEVIGAFAADSFGNFFTTQTGSFSLRNAGLVLLVLLACLGVVIWLFRRLQHLALVIRVRTLIRGILEGLTSIRHIRNKGAFFFHTFLIWVLYLLSTYMGFLALGDMVKYGLGGALSALTFGSFGMIIPSPGGIGSYQYAVQQVMILYGATPAQGLSLGMLIWLAQTAIFILSGTLAFLLLPVVNRNRQSLPGDDNTPTNTGME